MANEVARPIQLFFCYARKDQALRDELDMHLAPLRRAGLIVSWYDGKIIPGAAWEEEVEAQLNTADVILLLISPDFMSSEYIYSKEMKRALERHAAREAHVIPILLRPIDWEETPLHRLQMLPTNAKAVSSWSNRDEAFADVARGIRRVINKLRIQPASTIHAKAHWSTTQNFAPAVEQTVQKSATRFPDFKFTPRSLQKYWPWSLLLLIIIFLIIYPLRFLIQPYFSPNHSTQQLALVIDDPLTKQDNNRWSESPGDNGSQGCHFRGGNYHARAILRGIVICLANQTNVTNFVVQVEMTVSTASKSDGGGIIFRDNAANGYYWFNVHPDGLYELYNPGVATGVSPTIAYGYLSPLNNTPHTLKVRAQGSFLQLYVDDVLISHATDTTWTSGMVGVFAIHNALDTDISFSDFKLWSL